MGAVFVRCGGEIRRPAALVADVGEHRWGFGRVGTRGDGGAGDVGAQATPDSAGGGVSELMVSREGDDSPVQTCFKSSSAVALTLLREGVFISV